MLWTPDQAHAFAQFEIASPSKDWTRWCDEFCAMAYGFGGSGYNTALDHWNQVGGGSTAFPPPNGALHFWGGGAGHVAIDAGNNQIYSTDILGAGKVYKVPIGDIASIWGKPYLGWLAPTPHTFAASWGTNPYWSPPVPTPASVHSGNSGAPPVSNGQALPIEDEMAFATYDIPGDNSFHHYPIEPPHGGQMGWGAWWLSVCPATDVGGEYTLEVLISDSSPLGGHWENLVAVSGGNVGTDGQAAISPDVPRDVWTIPDGTSVWRMKATVPMSVYVTAKASLVTAPGAPAPAPVSTPASGFNPVSIPVSQVTYGQVDNSVSFLHTILPEVFTVMGITDPVAQGYWSTGLTTAATRESTDDFNAVNTTDSNATGPIVADGHPANCSRGVLQTIPPTFAFYHQAGTSDDIYDAVANTCAAMNYVVDHYGVSLDGHDLAAKVQQFDPSRSPKGY